MRISVLLLAIALVGLGAFASACGDDDGGGGKLTLEEYFEKIDELDDDQQAKSDELNKEVEDLGEDASPDDVADSFEKQVDLLQEFADDLDDLEPPSEVVELHDTVVTSLRAAEDEFGALIEKFREADSIEEAFGSFEDSDFTQIEKANEACRDLEEVAKDNNIEVDLDCEDE